MTWDQDDLKKIVEECVLKLNDEQCIIYLDIFTSIDNNLKNLYLLEESIRSAKIFLYNTKKIKF